MKNIKVNGVHPISLISHLKKLMHKVLHEGRTCQSLAWLPDDFQFCPLSVGSRCYNMHLLCGGIVTLMSTLESTVNKYGPKLNLRYV